MSSSAQTDRPACATLPGVAIPVLTPEDGAALDRALNEVAELASRSLIHTDLFLHYRNDKGWRAWFWGNQDLERAQAWVAEDGPWAGLLDALGEQVEPVAVIDSRLRRVPSQTATAPSELTCQCVVAFENRRTVAESDDGTIKVVEYPNGDLRVSIVRRSGRYTIERMTFDGGGGNIMLRPEGRAQGRATKR